MFLLGVAALLSEGSCPSGMPVANEGSCPLCHSLTNIGYDQSENKTRLWEQGITFLDSINFQNSAFLDDVQMPSELLKESWAGVPEPQSQL